MLHRGTAIRIASTRCLTILLALSALLAPLVSAEEITAEDLDTKWAFHGTGVHRVQGGMYYMREADDSKGVMVVSPESYEGDVVLRYELMPMTASSVCVAILAASDEGDGKSLTMPEDYDGNMGHWINEVKNYFFAFHNAAHNRTPFVVRFPDKGDLAQADANVMRSGEFHQIEVGRVDTKLWLKINGKLIFEAKDDNPLNSGHLAFRLRGIPHEPASCLMRNVTVESPE